MKTAVLLACLAAMPAIAQSPEAMKYASREVMLVSHEAGTEGVLPMVLTADGQQQLVFVPTSEIVDYMKRGARPIQLADILATLGAAQEKINALQAENDRLWKVAMKDNPQPATVVVQQTPAPVPDPSEVEAANKRRMAAAMLMMQNMNRPQTQNLNVTVSNCTRYPALCAGR